MNKFLKKITEATAGRDIPLNDRLSARMIFVSAIAGFCGMIVCLLAHTHMIAVGVTAFLSVAIPVCYTLCILNGRIKLLVIGMLISLIFLMPPLWLYGGGLRSGMSIWIVYEMVLFAVSLSGKIQIFAQFSSVFIFILCIVIERYTDYHYELLTHKDIATSVVGSVLIAGGIIIYMINFQKRLYRTEYELSEEKNAKLAALAEQAEKANNSQKVFLANMSHEVRSPMNVVLGFNHLISESENIEEIHDFAKNIESAGESLLVIVNDILDFSKIETGKMNLYPAAYNVDELAQMCASSIELLCKQKGLIFEMQTDPTIPKMLFGDKMRLRQCVTNLLTNAFKYTDMGSVKLKFENEGIREDVNKVMLRISVKDTGRGISEDQAKELFTRFQRLDESTNRAIEGTGLGLALTKSFVEMMGGTIDYTSAENEGSEFVIRLEQEIVALDAEPKAEESSAPEEPVPAVDPFDGMCVLVVDDSSTNLVLMKHLLKQLNVKAVTSASGLETLERVKNDRFDLIFMDHMMPHMDGVETFRRMKTFEHMNMDTPVVMLTANAMSGAEDEYRAEGFSGYLSKPVKLEDIKKELLRIRRLGKQT